MKPVRLLRWVFLCLAVTLAPAAIAVAQPATGMPDAPTEKTFQKLSEFIQPDSDERAWEKIGWHQELMPAVEQARELGRPILLWAMNGHPCGHT